MKKLFLIAFMLIQVCAHARYFDSKTGSFISRDPLGYVDGMSMSQGYFSRGMTVDPSGKSLTTSTPLKIYSIYDILLPDNNPNKVIGLGFLTVRSVNNCRSVCIEDGIFEESNMSCEGYLSFAIDFTFMATTEDGMSDISHRQNGRLMPFVMQTDGEEATPQKLVYYDRNPNGNVGDMIHGSSYGGFLKCSGGTKSGTVRIGQNRVNGSGNPRETKKLSYSWYKIEYTVSTKPCGKVTVDKLDLSLDSMITYPHERDPTRNGGVEPTILRQ